MRSPRAAESLLAMVNSHGGLTPSPWVVRWADYIVPGGKVLDLACGGGRHAAFLAEHAFQVVAVDIDTSTVAALPPRPNLKVTTADLENRPWPFGSDSFDGIVATNYLHRPLFPLLLAALRPLGILIYETFTVGNERFGRPGNPEFLLQPGELLSVVGGKARVLGFEDLFVDKPKPAMVQRVCARRE